MLGDVPLSANLCGNVAEMSDILVANHPEGKVMLKNFRWARTDLELEVYLYMPNGGDNDGGFNLSMPLYEPVWAHTRELGLNWARYVCTCTSAFYAYNRKQYEQMGLIAPEPPAETPN